MEYPYICQQCGKVEFFTNESPNSYVLPDDPVFIPRVCSYCGQLLISTDKSIEEYRDEYKDMTGIEIDIINDAHLIHPVISNDYIKRHPEFFNEALFVARIQKYSGAGQYSNHSKQIYCPNCSSSSVITQKQGFGFGKAAIGIIAAGPIGAAAGAINANKNWNVCQNCGHKWKI